MNKKILTFVLLLCISIGFVSCEKSTKETVIIEAKYTAEKDMAWAIAHYVEYPTEEMKFNRAGIVSIVFQIDEEGTVSQVKATIDEKLKEAEIAIARKKLVDKEVLPINLSVIESLIKSVERLNFQPAKKNGKPVSSTITTSVEFMLI